MQSVMERYVQVSERSGVSDLFFYRRGLLGRGLGVVMDCLSCSAAT